MNHAPTSPTTTQNGGGLSIAGMVLGIVGILTSWFGLGMLLGVVGIVLSSMGMKRKVNTGMAIAGLVTSICAIVFALPVMLVIVLTSYVGISTRADDARTLTNATSIQKVAESYNANNGTYPTFSELISYAPSQGLDQDVLDTVGNYKSGKDVTYLSCGTKGSIIYYNQISMIVPDKIVAGETTDCEY